jgi:beta-1,2-mannobiose phosphorylase / 1,2-beta-oligomannan phosphorylase
MTVSDDIPYRLTRLGVVMEPDPNDRNEVEGVLNPASGRDDAGRWWLLPRIVAAGNVSRVGLAELQFTDGVPAGVRREAVVLEPDEDWERSPSHAGVEDPRITYIADLGVHLMTYVAFGPLGPRPALAVSDDLRVWKRLGPFHFEYQADLGVDLNLCPNKDLVLFPDPVPGPDGRSCFAVLHRPMWDLDWIVPGAGRPLPSGMADDRPGIWISYASADAVRSDVSRLTHLTGHRLVALPEYPFEWLKIGAGPRPLRIPEGWLLIHHGVSGILESGFDHQQKVNYVAGAMILSADDPAVVIARSAEPLLAPETPEERDGIVPNVVFPTAIEEIDGRIFVFYGMADSKIGVAELTRTQS